MKNIRKFTVFLHSVTVTETLCSPADHILNYAFLHFQVLNHNDHIRT